MAVHLAVAGVIFDGVFFCAVFFFPQDVLDEILDSVESVPENFPTHSDMTFRKHFDIQNPYNRYSARFSFSLNIPMKLDSLTLCRKVSPVPPVHFSLHTSF